MGGNLVACGLAVRLKEDEHKTARTFVAKDAIVAQELADKFKTEKDSP